MLKFTPILLILLYAAAMWFFSAWRLKAELNQKSTPLQHPRLVPMLERLGRAMDLPRVQAHVYEVGHVNGLAAPDGRIFLTRGFLDRLDRGEVTEAELASVIAHELGHVAHGHTRRRMVDFAGQNVVRMVLAGVLGRFLPGIGVWIANLAASAIAARLSRQDEFEADAFASALMVKAGLGTEPQKSLFRKLDRLAGAGRAGAPAWLMSHPPAAARIAAIEKLEARWELA
ncbi:peptidase M48 (plasmid) [Paracoccus versutus]|jgi:putative metalloprotease|uniref:Metalloprotease n=1 Tax=Paracoccus versutus TaxID=34007 RepID=A0A099FI40_PARVE|nr:MULTISPECIES: M48 family metallopeptidase [Paracoccus]WGR63462.1 peptidase M48 [Paracoccus ferrooxidans]KGJ09838.1 peptidase M48 [Paracoccus versutus]MBT0782066.1 M48 family metallopeptidase [Paracoccus sp. pheM1]MCJ1902555.1 M48 family metallopeptidase [Paracoccus versutus]MDF3905852.1 M48 family metallopeptidase [Paracoccus sp. AS002]